MSAENHAKRSRHAQNARGTALCALRNVLHEGAYLNLELKTALQGMKDEDKRFAAALVNTTIENLFRIDYVIDRFSNAKRLHSVVRDILRLGVCQLMFFESVPVSAAVNESVKLAVVAGKKQLKGFVNATLRNIADHLGGIEYPDRETDFINYLHVLYSYPKWLCEKYTADYGRAQAEEMLAYKADHAYTCMRINRLQGVPALPEHKDGRYFEDAIYIKSASNIEEMPLYKDGFLSVQGEASMLCVASAGVGKTDKVLDACAAPGGKAAYAAQFAQDGSVLALDKYEHRVKLIQGNFARLGIMNGEAKVQDVTLFDKALEGAFDMVLLDVPCSALGLLHRKPDIKLKEKPGEDLAALQRKILLNCANYVKPGGTLIYSTCTISREENEQNASWFLEKDKRFDADGLEEWLPAALKGRADGNMIQLFPHKDGIDGFFIARFKRGAQ